MKKITFLTLFIALISFTFCFGQGFTTSGLTGLTIQNNPAGSATISSQTEANQFRAPVIITHSASQAITPATGVVCSAGGEIRQNSLFRAFNLNSFGISNDFQVTNAEFGVETMNAPFNVTVNIYSTTSVFPAGFPASLILEGSAIVTLGPANSGTVVSVPVSAIIPAGTTLVFEVAIPDGTGTGISFFPGANSAGQTGPSYIASAPCGITVPTNYAAIGFPNSHLVMNIVGEELAGIVSCSPNTPLPLGPAAGTITLANTSIAPVAVIGVNNGDYILDEVSMNLTHTWGSDLEIVLISPSGTEVRLSRRRGGSGGLSVPRDLVFRDDSPNMITGWTSGAPLANYMAEGGSTAHPMPAGNGPGVLMNTVFAGQPINGNWTLRLYDAVNGDGGTIFDFCINFIEVSGPVGNPPQIVCPLNITVNTSDYPPNDCGAQVFFANAQAFDPEDGLIPVTQTMGPGTGSVFPVGVTTIEFSATDSDGNTSTCQFTITVLDDVNPVAVCQNITVELDASGTVSINAVDLDGGSSDLCTGVNFSFDMAGSVTTMMFDCSDLGENTITLYVTDGGGNVVSCQATVTVEDNIAPEIVCTNAGGLQIISEDFDSGLPSGWQAIINTGTCNWQNGNLPATWLGGQFTFPTPAMFFNDDACGSGAAPSNATLLSDVYDTNGATSLELSYDVAYRHLGGSSFTVEVFDGASWQNVATYTANTPVSTAGPFDLLAFANSNFQVRYTYDDGGGWQWGAAVDNFLLEFETPAGTIPQYFLDANGVVTVPITDLYTSVSDNCTVVVSAGGASGGTPDVLTTGFAGGNGNFGTFFDINALNDITINSFDAHMQPGSPVDVLVYYKPGTWVGSQTNQAAWTLIGEAPGTVPNGAGVPTPLNLNLGQVINAGETGAFYVTAQVLNGGFSYTNGTGTGNIWAQDDNLQFLEGGAVGGFFTGSLFQPRVFNGNIHYTAGGGTTGDLTFTCADLGIVNVTVTATDAAGNTTSCIAQIEIIDNIPPVVVGEDITVELGPDGTVCIVPEDLFGIIPPLYNVITISSDNGSGAEGWTDLIVNVTSNVTVSFDWSYTTMDGPTWDQFGYIINGVYTELTNPAGANNQTGNASVPLTAGQVFGFRARSSDGLFGPATITVSNFMPGFTGQFDPSNWTEVLTNSDGSATFVEIAPGSSSAWDNCGITVTAIDISCFTCADIGNPVTVTIFVSDASGNIASSTAVVTVVDLLGPEIVCPADMTVDTDPDSITYTLPDYFATGLASVTDNCTDPVTIFGQSPAPGTLLLDGTYTITLFAEDEYGNESECTFELTVETILGNDDNVLTDAIIMYPNPANSYVNIRNNSQIGLTQASIYDINGKLVSKFDLSQMSNEQRLDVSNLASGVYMVYIQSETASVVKRLIKK